MRIVFFSLIASLFVLMGCASSEKSAEKRDQREIEQCTKQGLTPGTEAFMNCRLQLRITEDKQAAEFRKSQQQQEQRDRFHRNIPRIR